MTKSDAALTPSLLSSDLGNIAALGSKKANPESQSCLSIFDPQCIFDPFKRRRQRCPAAINKLAVNWSAKDFINAAT